MGIMNKLKKNSKIKTTAILSDSIFFKDFISFSKDNQANVSSLLGYYAKFRFQNNDANDHSELFSVGVDFFESSK